MLKPKKRFLRNYEGSFLRTQLQFVHTKHIKETTCGNILSISKIIQDLLLRYEMKESFKKKKKNLLLTSS